MSSGNVQAFHKQVIAPTGASHALSCRLTRAYDSGSLVSSHLITARENVLQVWETRHTTQKASTSTAPPTENDQRLFHVATRKLHGSVTSLNRVRTLDSKKDGADRVLVSFADAKMALMEWSIEANDLLPVSLHTFEKLPQVREGRAMCAVDPSSRLAVMLLPSNTGGDGSLAILPFFQDEMDMDALTIKTNDTAFGDQNEAFAQTPYAPSHVLPLSTLTASSVPAASIISASSTLSNAITANGPPPIRNVVDMVFLPGFNEPTLALLYAPEQTWTGRLENVSDNYLVSLVALSPATGTAVNATSTAVIISTSPALPYNCLAIQACPPAIGGVLITTSNGLIHLEQSGKMVGAAANGWFDRDFKGRGGSASKTTESETTVRQALEGSRTSFVSDTQALIFCKSGAVVSATLVVSGRSVEGFKLKTIAHTVAAACIERIRGSFGETGHLFLGSENAECLLLRWRATADVDDQSSRATVNGQSAHDDMDLDDEDAEIYGTSEPVVTNGNGHAANGIVKKTGISLSICDTIESYGAVRSMAVGRTEFEAGPEIVAATGAGKTAGLTIFHRTIAGRKKRKLDASAPLATRGLWSLPSGETSVLITSDDTTTRLRRQGDKLESFAAPTCALRSFPADGRAVHVLEDRVRITDTDLVANEWSVAFDLPVESAQILADWISVDAQGSSQVWKIDRRKASRVPTLDTDSVCSSLYLDVNGSLPVVKKSAASQDLMELDDENGDDLYATKINHSQDNDKLLSSIVPAPTGGRTLHTIVSRAGRVRIRDLPSGKTLFDATTISLLPDVLVDGDDVSAPDYVDPDDLQIERFGLVPMGAGRVMPHLLVLLKDGTLAVYEARPSLSIAAKRGNRDETLGVVFAKVLSRRLPAATLRRARKPDGAEDDSRPPCSRLFRPFSLNGLSGVFATGDEPFWLVKSDHGPVRLVEHHEKDIYAMCESFGSDGTSFVVQTPESLEIAEFPSNLVFDADLPYTRVARDRIYTHLAYDVDSGLYVGAATFETPFSNFDDEGKPLFTEGTPEMLEPKSYRSALELIIPGSWQAIDGYEFRQNEFVTSMRSAPLESKSKRSGMKDFIIVGTGTARGEDLPAKGGIYVFEVTRIFPDPSVPAINHVLDLRCFEEAKSVIGTIGAIDGYLIIAMGQKLYMRALEQDRFLIAVGFLDVGIHVTCMETLKNFLLIGDAMQSVMLVAFQEDPYKLVMLARDHRTASATTVNFLVNDSKVCFVESDIEGDLRFFEYELDNPAAAVEQRLICRVEYHAGSETGTSIVYAKKGANELEARQNGVLYGSIDGSLATVVPVRDAVFRRLQALQTQLIRHVQHFGGLNPRAFRIVRNDTVSRAIVKGVLDGELLAEYEMLDLAAQSDLAARCRSDRDTILLNMRNTAAF